MAVTFTPGVSDVVGTASQLSGALADPATATQGGTGITAVTANQVPVGTAAGTYVAALAGERMIAYSTNLVLTASGDVLMSMSNPANLGSYIVRRVTWGAPVTAALATVIVVALLRSASGGGGSALTGALVVTGLSATNGYLDQAVTLASTMITSSQLYVNITTPAATAPSSQLFVWATPLGV